MVPSLVSISTLALAAASKASSGNMNWSLKETYDKDNSLDSFEFFYQADPTIRLRQLYEPGNRFSEGTFQDR
jgi:hypothetical protein